MAGDLHAGQGWLSLTMTAKNVPLGTRTKDRMETLSKRFALFRKKAPGLFANPIVRGAWESLEIEGEASLVTLSFDYRRGEVESFDLFSRIDHCSLSHRDFPYQIEGLSGHRIARAVGAGGQTRDGGRGHEVAAKDQHDGKRAPSAQGGHAARKKMEQRKA